MRKPKKQQRRLRINRGIKSPELRVIDEEKGNLGVMKTEEAISIAESQGLDLIEISPQAKPPIAKITDYGKFQYDRKKKEKAVKSKAHTVEVKNIQIKLATGEGDLALKAKKASEWLSEGHRVKAELYLRGRAKYMDKPFLKERLERILKSLTVDYRVVEDIKKSPKGIIMLIEPAKGTKKKQPEKPKETSQKAEKTSPSKS